MRFQKYLMNWESGAYETMADKKRKLLSKSKAFDRIPLSPLFEPLRPWFEAFAEPFADGIHRTEKFERKNKQFLRKQLPVTPESPQEFETMHGAVTLLNFLEKFDMLEVFVADDEH